MEGRRDVSTFFVPRRADTFSRVDHEIMRYEVINPADLIVAVSGFVYLSRVSVIECYLLARMFV
jgi:hypothetical protein